MPRIDTDKAERLEALACHLGQNESLYLDTAGAEALVGPRKDTESQMAWRMRADAHFRVMRAKLLAEAVDQVCSIKD